MYKKIFILLCISSFSIADPIDTDFMVINNYSLKQTSDIWDRLRSGFQLDFKQTKRVKYYEKFYTKNPKTFNKLINNMLPYLYFVLTQAERYGLPSELVFIPIVESNYDSFIANATGRYDGIWQFIPSTGVGFGLYEDNNINDRRNIIKATNAAMMYFNYLYLLFKQWDVAIGAYNWGPGNLYKAIKASNQPIGEVDYTTLPLRDITANYVPKIIALANIIKNPEKFGVSLPNVPNQPYFSIHHTNSSVTEVIKVSKTDKNTFKILNPQFKNNDYNLTNNMQVLLPISNQNIYLASIDKKKPNLTYYDNSIEIDAKTDMINKIAYADVNNSTNNETILIKPKQLSNTNITTNLPKDKPIYSKDIKEEISELVDNLDNDTTNTNEDISIPSKYTVSTGDTLFSIAKKFKLPISKLKQINKITNDSIYLGQIINLY